MNSTDQQYSNNDWTSKPGEEQNINNGSDTTKENDSSGQSNEERGFRGNRGRGRGRGGFRGGNRGRGRDFHNNNMNENENVAIPGNACDNLFVKGINYEATEEDLKETFSKYGDVTSCKILKDKETKKSKGCGFVNFADKKSAVCALNDADNLICKGRNLQVRFADDKEGEFKGRKGGSNHREENNNNNRGRGGDRGRGRGGFRGNDRGNRGGRGGRGRGNFRGGNRNDDNNNGDDWSGNKEDNNNGWGGSNDRERSRSKEKNECSW